MTKRTEKRRERKEEMEPGSGAGHGAGAAGGRDDRDAREPVGVGARARGGGAAGGVRGRGRGGGGAQGPTPGGADASSLGHDRHGADVRRAGASRWRARGCGARRGRKRAARGRRRGGSGIRWRPASWSRSCLGVSTRGYAGSLEAAPVGVRSRGTSKSAVSRTLRARLTTALRGAGGPAPGGARVAGAVPRRRRDRRPDGDRRRSGSPATARRCPLGLRLGSTENAVVCTELAPGPAGARADDRRARALRDRRRQRAAQGDAGRARHRGGDPALPAPQSPQPAGPGAEGASGVCPAPCCGERTARPVPARRGASSTPSAPGSRPTGTWTPRRACARVWRKRSRC